MQEDNFEFLDEESDDSRQGLELAVLRSSASNASDLDTASNSSIGSVDNNSIVPLWDIASGASSPALSIDVLFREEDSNEFEDYQFSTAGDSEDMASLFSADSFDSVASTVTNSNNANDVEDSMNAIDFEDNANDGEDSVDVASDGEDSVNSHNDEDVVFPINQGLDHSVEIIDNDPVEEVVNVVDIVSSGSSDGATDEVAQVSVSNDKPSVSGTQSQPKAMKRRAEASLTDDDEDGQMCSICMDVWSNSGDHRLSSLRCGHLFGHKCIVHWLGVARARGGARRCPQCNKPAKLTDVRVLYAKRLVSVDTSDQDAIKLKLQQAETERNKLEVELKKVELRNQLQEKQLAELRSKLTRTAAVAAEPAAHWVPAATEGKGPGNGEVKLVLQHTQEINKDGGCRVLAYKESINLVVISQVCTSLFSGFGISKVNALNFRSTQFIYLHSKAIRDLAFHTTDNDLLLSVSLDRSAKLLDVSSNNVVQTYLTDTPLWSCGWDAVNSNILLLGGQNGCVLQYDMRQTSSPCGRFTDNQKAVISVAGVGSGGALPRGGFLACHLDSCWAYEQVDAELVGKQLPVEGPFVAMRYDRATDHMLLSSRPSARSLRARHVVCGLDRLPATRAVTCNEAHTFTGGVTQNLLSRPSLMQVRGYGSAVVAHNESSNTLAVWNMASGARVCNQPAKEPVLDTCPIYLGNNQYLGTVSEKTFRVYRVTH